jgi:threonine synthase
LGAPHRKVSFTVPTGNFGDIFAGYIAKRMGLPIDRLVIATNQNDILHRALTTGEYRTNGVKPSISPSMDIQVSSNFERALFDAYGRDGAAVRGADGRDEGRRRLQHPPGRAADACARRFASGRCSEDETAGHHRHRRWPPPGEVLCPHSAVGVKVAKSIWARQAFR